MNMMKQILDRVTITGADDSIRPEDLIGISEAYPFVEWGILLSKNNMGCARFPSLDWMKRLAQFKTEHPNTLHLSGHLCGAWVRNLCKGGDSSFTEELEGTAQMYERIQLNFHAQRHKTDAESFINALFTLGIKQYIVQWDNVNTGFLDLIRYHQLKAAPLFDLSGGNGVLPKEWPRADGYCGYAGGLSPENVQGQLELICEKVGKPPVWIDTETRVRSEDDQQFDLGKVRTFLEQSKPYVMGRES